jgi:restriction endonuclease Mrr
MKSDGQIMKDKIELQDKINRQKAKMSDRSSKLQSMKIDPETNAEFKQMQAEQQQNFRKNEELRQQTKLLQTTNDIQTENMAEESRVAATVDLIANPPESMTELQQIIANRVGQLNINRNQNQMLAQFLNQVIQHTDIDMATLINSPDVLTNLVSENWEIVQNRNVQQFIQNYGGSMINSFQ